MAIEESLPLGVVLERRRSNHPWQDFVWRPVAVIPGASERDPAGEWTLLREGDGWAQYHAGTLRLSLFRKETEAYKVNLSQDPPRIFVVLRSGAGDDTEHDMVPYLVSASPYEVQDYLDSGEEIVEGVAMPPGVIAFVQFFVEQHHIDEPFYKRKRKRHDPDKVGFGRKPPAETGGSGED